MPGAPGWVLPTYYAIAAWWTLSGVWDILQSTVFAKEGLGFFGGITILIGAVTALADHLDVFLGGEKIREALAGQRFVVGDQGGQGHGSFLRRLVGRGFDHRLDIGG